LSYSGTTTVRFGPAHRTRHADPPQTILIAHRSQAILRAETLRIGTSRRRGKPRPTRPAGYRWAYPPGHKERLHSVFR